MKVVPSNNDITTAACSCKLASTHIYCVDSNYKKSSIDLETNTKSNKSLDKIRNQQNKNTTEKLDSDNIKENNKKQRYRSENHTKKKEKKDEENKRYEYARKLETSKTMYHGKIENCIYFKRQHGKKKTETRWVSPYKKKSDINSLSKFVHFQLLN